MEKTFVASSIAIKKILYATDFSKYSDAALPFALSLARKYRSKVFAVHVLSLLPFPKISLTQASQALAAQALREAAEAMRLVEARCKSVPHESLILKGSVWSELSRMVRDEHIDLLVLGTHGRTGVSKVLMGSVAEEIYRQAPCPVLTVGPNVAAEPESVGDIHSILYPTDFTPESLAAAPYAVSLARENDARLYLLHIAENPVTGTVQEALTSRLLDLAPEEAGLCCAPKAIVDFGVPAEKIAELAEELWIDLIVLGPRRKPALPGASHLPEASANRVVSRAICPVLTVREGGPHSRSEG